MTSLQLPHHYLRDDPYWWFWMVLVFVLRPALIAGLFFLHDEDWLRRVLVVLHLGLVWEAYTSITGQEYPHVLVKFRAVEPLYESVPQLMVQLYALLLVWDDTSSDISSG
ncbi:unnamed protein product, partial [Choristocarpus tenellus]